MADLGNDVLDLPAGARIVVAMSGGVDSAVTAALLHEAGFEVVGVTLQLYDHGRAAGRKGACCAGQDIQDARDAAGTLGIPHYVLDMERRFKAAVIDDFAATYAQGRTPVPCVRCNERVKFQDLSRVARDLGASALATGHYARRFKGPILAKGRDPAKDQSYFLFKTTREQLDFLRFPLGSLSKAETRRHAARFDLPLAEKPESQDICFVPRGHYSDVVAKLAPEAAVPGEVVDTGGRVLGRHKGIGRFTVGQRRGLNVAGPERLYVVGIEPGRHRVVVGPRRASLSGEAALDEVNWLAEPLKGPRPVMARHRYNEPAVAAEVRRDGEGRYAVRFATPQAGVALGQACVLYDGDRVLGGGWIKQTVPARPTESGEISTSPAASAAERLGG